VRRFARSFGECVPTALLGLCLRRDGGLFRRWLSWVERTRGRDVAACVGPAFPASVVEGAELAGSVWDAALEDWERDEWAEVDDFEELSSEVFRSRVGRRGYARKAFVVKTLGTGLAACP